MSPIETKAKLLAEKENHRLRYTKYDDILRPIFKRRKIRKIKDRNFNNKVEEIRTILDTHTRKRAKIATAWINAHGGNLDMSTLSTQEIITVANDFAKMSPAIREQITSIANKIDIHDQSSMLSIGSDLLDVNNSAIDDPLSKVKTKDIKEMGEQLTKMVSLVKGLDASKLPVAGATGWLTQKFIALRGGMDAAIERFRNEFLSVHSSVNSVANELEVRVAELLRYIEILKGAYAIKVKNYHTYSMLIAGIEIAISNASEELTTIREKAEKGDLESVEQAAMITERIQQLERKVSDYTGFRMATIGTLAEYRFLGSMCFNMADKINTAVVGTLPLWKDKMLTAIVRSSLDQATSGLNSLSDMTNTMLVDSANQMRNSAANIQRTIENPLISANTVKEVNEAFLGMLEDTYAIVKEGQSQRALSRQQIEEEERRLKDGMLRGSYESIEQNNNKMIEAEIVE